MALPDVLYYMHGCEVDLIRKGIYAPTDYQLVRQMFHFKVVVSENRIYEVSPFLGCMKVHALNPAVAANNAAKGPGPEDGGANDEGAKLGEAVALPVMAMPAEPAAEGAPIFDLRVQPKGAGPEIRARQRPCYGDTFVCKPGLGYVYGSIPTTDSEWLIRAAADGQLMPSSLLPPAYTSFPFIDPMKFPGDYVQNAEDHKETFIRDIATMIVKHGFKIPQFLIELHNKYHFFITYRELMESTNEGAFGSTAHPVFFAMAWLFYQDFTDGGGLPISVAEGAYEEVAGILKTKAFTFIRNPYRDAAGVMKFAGVFSGMPYVVLMDSPRHKFTNADAYEVATGVYAITESWVRFLAMTDERYVRQEGQRAQLKRCFAVDDGDDDLEAPGN